MQEAKGLGVLKVQVPVVMDHRNAYKDVISEVIETGFLYYGRAFIAKVSSTGLISISPVGEIVSINGDPVLALKATLNVFEDISGRAVTGRALDIVKAFIVDHPELKSDIDPVIDGI